MRSNEAITCLGRKKPMSWFSGETTIDSLLGRSALLNKVVSSPDEFKNSRDRNQTSFTLVSLTASSDTRLVGLLVELPALAVCLRHPSNNGNANSLSLIGKFVLLTMKAARYRAAWLAAASPEDISLRRLLSRNHRERSYSRSRWPTVPSRYNEVRRIPVAMNSHAGKSGYQSLGITRSQTQASWTPSFGRVNQCFDDFEPSLQRGQKVPANL